MARGSKSAYVKIVNNTALHVDVEEAHCKFAQGLTSNIESSNVNNADATLLSISHCIPETNQQPVTTSKEQMTQSKDRKDTT